MTAPVYSLPRLTWRIHVLRNRPRTLWRPGAIRRSRTLSRWSRSLRRPQPVRQFGPPPLTPDIAPQPGASFGEAVKRFFQRYAQFSGYASRSEYWWVALFNALVGLGIYVLLFMVVGLGGALGGSSDDVGTSIGIGAIIVMLLAFAYAIATFIPGLALTVRRLHDVGKPGTWWFIQLIPFGVGTVWFLILMASESRPDLYRPEWS